MADAPTVEWEGKSATKYTYWIYPLGTTMKTEPGNYIFAREGPPNNFEAVYIGETGDLNDRLNVKPHEKEPCTRENGATHIHTHTNPNGEDVRRAEETDLIERFNPPCNDG